MVPLDSWQSSPMTPASLQERRLSQMDVAKSRRSGRHAHRTDFVVRRSIFLMAATGRHARPRDSLVRNSFFLMAATIVTSVLGYAFWALAAHLYPSAVIGEAGAGVSAMAFASLLGAVGGSSAIIAELPGKRRPYEWSATVTTALVFTSLTSAAAAIGTVIVLSRTGNSAFLYRDAWWIAAFVVGVVATTASQLLENIWVAERQAGWFLGASSVFAVTKLAFVAIPVLVVFGATGILSIWSAVLAVTVAGCLLVLARMYGYRPRLSGFRQQIWSMRQTLTGNYAITVGDQITLYLIPVVVAFQVSPSAAGWFYASWKIGGFYAVFASAIGSTTFAEGSHTPERALPVAISGMKLILPLIALGAAVTIFGGRLVLSIFGSGYAAHGYTLLVLLSLAAFPDAVVNIYRSVLRVRRRYKTATAICWAISIVRIVLTSLGVARFGIVGAGWAWLITQTGGAIWCILDLAVHRNPATPPDTCDDDSILDQTLELRRIEW
jgi:O-antigen/teichoic acid export membrane protein